MKLKVLRSILFLGSGLLLSQSCAQAPTPEKSHSLWMALPAFLVMGMFVASIFCWGAVIRNRFRLPFFSETENAFFDIACGSVLMYWVAYGLTGLGLFSVDHRFLLWGFLATGFGAGSTLIKPSKWFPLPQGRWARLSWALPLLIVALKLIEGFQFHQHGDAYITYLPAPRSWAIHGGFQDFPRFTEYFLATSWESLFAWGTALMGLHGGAGLDLSQWFSQWTTGGIAVLGLVLGLTALAQRLAKKVFLLAEWSAIAVVSALQLPSLRWTANLAKNDMGICFWGVAAFYGYLFFMPTSSFLAFVTGTILGAAVIGKLTLVVFGLVITLAAAINRRKGFWPMVFGGIVGVAPVLIRNWEVAHNPVYPWFSQFFQTPFGQHAPMEKQKVTAFALHLSSFGPYFLELLKEIPLLAGMGLGMIALKRTRSTLEWTWVPLLGAVAFTFLIRPATEIRYQEAPLVLLGFFATYFSFFFLQRVLSEKKAHWASMALSLVMIATANVSFFTIGQIGGRKFTAWSSRSLHQEDIGGPAKVWMRSNLDSQKRILFVGDPFPYYMMDYPIALFEFDDLIKQQVLKGEPANLVETLKRSVFDYVYFNQRTGDEVFHPSIAKTNQYLAGTHPNCRRYLHEDEQVWDLGCVRTPKP